MRLGYFTMPVHPMHRDWSETLREDRAAIILADKLGFHDAFMGEHLTDKCENVTNSMMFLATLIPETQRIKLATGTANLSQMHPLLIAEHPLQELCAKRCSAFVALAEAVLADLKSENQTEGIFRRR